MKKESLILRLNTLIKPVVESQGLMLWDIEFKKEGASWYLRVFIDKEDGVTIDDCELISRALDPVLDDADIIEQSYYLEVSSPGVERVLKNEMHFKQYEGSRVVIKLYAAIDGQKELEGTLEGMQEGNVYIRENDILHEIKLSDISIVKLKIF